MDLVNTDTVLSVFTIGSRKVRPFARINSFQQNGNHSPALLIGSHYADLHTRTNHGIAVTLTPEQQHAWREDESDHRHNFDNTFRLNIHRAMVGNKKGKYHLTPHPKGTPASREGAIIVTSPLFPSGGNVIWGGALINQDSSDQPQKFEPLPGTILESGVCKNIHGITDRYQYAIYLPKDTVLSAHYVKDGERVEHNGSTVHYYIFHNGKMLTCTEEHRIKQHRDPFPHIAYKN